MLSFPTGNQPSVLTSGHSFSQVPKADIQRSSFNRSHGHKTAFNAGYLIPVFVDEALPGDSFNLKMQTFARLSTPIVPFMDNLFLFSAFYAVPYRLVWSNFKKFCGEQATTAASTAFTIPQFTAYAPASESLSDYMGIPISGATTPMGAGGTIAHSCLWHRAYNLIWNEWFRDQNLQDSVKVGSTASLDDGPDAIADYVLLKRGKRHDYFTSCLPWTQKNNTGSPVAVGLVGTAPVGGLYAGGTAVSAGASMFDSLGNDLNGLPGGIVDDVTPGRSLGVKTTSAAAINGTTNKPLVYADLSAASGITINALRLAFQTQKMYERDARGGTRYREIIQSHFGVLDPNDARLQRPEYLGGSTVPVMLSPVPQTSVTSGAYATGRLSAVGTVHGRSGFVKSFSEHCLLIGLVCVYADLNYQAGLNRMWSRSTRLDHYWPALANIGEQAVYNKEIYCQGSANAAQDAATFGYQERFAEYRYKPSQITGKMRSQTATPLDYWHLAQKFTGLPTLGTTFIQEAPPIDRVVAVNTEPQFFFDSFFDLKCARPMPTYSVPGLIDHF
ncbi:MAG: major capsid protein [Arizlama microvirus]|nr:MAG: major capsid protein [Arizlama microvirus]